MNKTIKEYTVEELKGLLMQTKASQVDAQELLQHHTQTRQFIEQELVGREKEVKETEEALTNVIEEIAKPKSEWSEEMIKEGEKAKTKKTK